MADVTEIKDANGKTFSVDISKICDINGDLGDKASASVTDSLKNRVTHLHDVEYVNQKGEIIDATQLLNDMASGKTRISALDVELEATHSGKNHNYCVYYEDSMEKDAESFMNPFRKPMLKNHDSYSEPLGRIIQSSYGPSALTDERSAIHLKVRVTDQDAIPKFLDGRYGTVSIGGTMGTVTCNICGKTILKDGKFKFCGHWRGETYKDEVCYWGAKDITYHEVSTVNNPADDFAQVMKVTVVTDGDDKKDSKEEKEMPQVENADNMNAEMLKKSVCDMIDDLLGNSKASDAQETPEVPEVKNEGEAHEEIKDNTAEKAQDSENEIEELKAQLADAKAENKALQESLEDKKAELVKAQEELTAALADAASFKEKSIALATANKERIADSIIAKESLENEAKDARKEELMAMSMKDLQKLAEENTVEDKQQREIASVTNPTLANEDSNTNNSEIADVNKKPADDAKAKKTVDDFAQDIVSKLVK